MLSMQEQIDQETANTRGTDFFFGQNTLGSIDFQFTKQVDNDVLIILDGFR